MIVKRITVKLRTVSDIRNQYSRERFRYHNYRYYPAIQDIFDNTR